MTTQHRSLSSCCITLAQSRPKLLPVRWRQRTGNNFGRDWARVMQQDDKLLCCVVIAAFYFDSVGGRGIREDAQEPIRAMDAKAVIFGCDWQSIGECLASPAGIE